MPNHKERDPNTHKTGKPNLHSKSISDLQAMANTARPKQKPMINRMIAKKSGRGR